MNAPMRDVRMNAPPDANLSLAYPSPMGTYGLDASIIMKFGLNTTWWCGNRIPLSEIHIFSLSAFGGWGGNLSLAYPSPMGTYGLDASIIMKFGLNTT